MMNQFNLEESELRNAREPIIIILLAFFGFIFLGGLGAVLGNLMSHFYDVDLAVVLNGPDIKQLDFPERQSVRWANLVSHACAFMFVSLIVAFVAKKNSSLTQFLGLQQGIKPTSLLWALLALLLVFPGVQLIYWLNMQIPLPHWILEMGKSQDWLIAEVLRMEHLSELFFVLIVAAVAPAVGEELLFRGVLQVQFARLFKNVHGGIWAAAFLFSAIHMQFDGFFPRMFLGALLGYMYLWSNSLWLPILIHFLFNGIQVVFSYLNPELADVSSPVDIDSLGLIMGCVALVLLSPVLLKLRSSSIEKTLP